MVDLPVQLGNDAFDRMMRGVARGRYQALLGSGASADSCAADGWPLPTAEVLQQNLRVAFDLPDDSRANLRRTYQMAKDRTSTDGLTMNQYLKRHFTDTEPADWLQDLLKLQWAGLWTLNIDDTLERAHSRAAASARQRLRSISWTERHRTPRSELDEVLLVHLHGKASRSGREDEIVFDISSYVNSLTSQHTWLKIFGDEFPASPFVIIGASLDEEIDLQSIFDEGRLGASAEHPSVIVLRDISPFQRQEYESYGLLPVVCTGADFVAAVRSALPAFLQDMVPDDAMASAATAKEAIRFTSQWQQLFEGSDSRSDRFHDLYAGHEPKWTDVLRGYVSDRQSTVRIVRQATQALDIGKHSITVVAGEAFSGKSSILLSAAQGLIHEGFWVFRFNGEFAVDQDALFWWLIRFPKTVLLIDNASDFAKDVDKSLLDRRAGTISLRAILVERASAVDHIESVLIVEDHTTLQVPPSLSRVEVNALIGTLERHSRLGVVTDLDSRERMAFFSRHHRRLFSAMAALEDGRGFQDRIKDEFDKIATADGRRLLAVVGLASDAGYYLPLGVVKTAVGLTVRQVEEALQGQGLVDLLAVENDRVTARHRIFGTLLVRYLSKQEKIDALVSLMTALAPHVSIPAISASTIYYRMARALMGRAFLSEHLERDDDAVLEVYEGIEAAYAWNVRYWEQRALAAAAAGYFERAYSWAQQAVQRRHDSYTLNTVGVVLMQRAVYEAKAGVWPVDTFESAEAYLSEARRLEGSKAEYPIETFFTYLIRLLRCVPKRDEVLNRQIRELWSVWYSAILVLEESSRMRLARTMDEVRTAWEVEGFDRI